MASNLSIHTCIGIHFYNDQDRLVYYTSIKHVDYSDKDTVRFNLVHVSVVIIWRHLMAHCDVVMEQK